MANADVVPPRPTLDALFAADFTTAYYELEEDEEAGNKLWMRVQQEFRALGDHVGNQTTMAFGSNPPGHFDVQASNRQVSMGLQALGDVLAQLSVIWVRSYQGLQHMGMRAADVVAHRPAAMAIFRKADAPLEAPIDTPTLGPRISDEDSLIRGLGLNFF